MNTLTIHEHVALKNLEDRTVWRALVDHHEETLEVPRRVAVRSVAILRYNARRCCELAKGVEAIKGHGHFAESIKDTIRACCGDDLAWSAKIIVREGRKRPVLYLASDELGRPVPRAHTILVGARFVLLLARLRREVMRVESEVHANVASHLFNV